ncbi:DNA polymerase III subunit chi [Haemophilus influenzae]|nr:DNA polymerase III subunit chi [Haemophilus influenzae]NKB85332.1 DNA polymerase III subunit chi [Haemophilus influenzae]POP29421.1 DNA polymerase III subunit chi [Haemophilus influenzae]RDT72516.1 DNA polymerase III subunit chi [Haemophilus influenzae]RFO49337.1 DNA polymerase III subunit chi [Haemophilus influenzae]
MSYCDEIFIYDNSGITPELIFQLKDNCITQFSEFLPSWCEKILNNLRKLGFEKIF